MPLSITPEAYEFISVNPGFAEPAKTSEGYDFININVGFQEPAKSKEGYDFININVTLPPSVSTVGFLPI